MNKTAVLENAISIAALAHKGQTDKSDTPSILHPLRLIMRMTTEAAMMTAIFRGSSR